MVGCSVPPVVTEYGMGESLETAVTNGVGTAVPCTQLILRVIPSATLSVGALFVISRLTGTMRSADPETETAILAV